MSCPILKTTTVVPPAAAGPEWTVGKRASTTHIASSISPTGSALSLRNHRRDTWLCTVITTAAMSSALSDVD